MRGAILPTLIKLHAIAGVTVIWMPLDSSITAGSQNPRAVRMLQQFATLVALAISERAIGLKIVLLS